MTIRKYAFLFPIVLGALLLAGLAIFWPPVDASAQCGSQASSCKNCHEVQGQDSVNSDGTGWHQSHAFGDFCYICHAGNNQSMDKATAHTGMVAPLSDTKAACLQCHPDDLQARAQVYATTLGVTLDASGNAPSGSGPAAGGQAPSGGEPANAAGSEAPAANEPAVAPAQPEMVTGQGEVIDYNQRYAGKTPLNWGNLVLGALIVLMTLGGGAYVVAHERKLRGLAFLPASRRQTGAKETGALPQVEGYPAEVVALLPLIARLNPVGLHALRRLLENPADANELLASLSRLDPQLVRKIRSMDREARAMLLALSGD